jgi:hypothetical protein
MGALCGIESNCKGCEVSGKIKGRSVQIDSLTKKKPRTSTIRGVPKPEVGGSNLPGAIGFRGFKRGLNLAGVTGWVTNRACLMPTEFLPMKFHDRFNIEVGQDESRRRFVNRTHNKIFVQISEDAALTTRAAIGRAIGCEIGEIYVNLQPIHTFVGADFFKNLQAIEGWYGYMQRVGTQASTDTMDSMIQDLISQSEVDLGIRWVNGKFIRKGRCAPR